LRKPIWRNSDLWLVGALIVVAVYAGCNVFPRVSFDRERIDVWALPHQIQVRGLYHYRNPSSLPAFLSLGLPFPVDAEHPRPTFYSVATVTKDGETLEYIRCREHFGDVRFRVFLRPHEAKWVRVDYVQSARTPQGTYILTTTRKWGHPLLYGDYILHLGQGLHLVEMNYPPDFVSGNNTYSFSKSNFYPSEDWKFAWSENAASTGERDKQ
jgi:hypothetical protein